MSKKNSENSSFDKCAKCGQLCCRYLTIKIPAPRTITDFDGLLWQLAHENVKAFRDRRGWYLLVYNPCIHLGKDGSCSVYESRPITCRQYSIEECEYGTSIKGTSLKYFDNFKELDRYCRKKFRTWDNRY